MRLRRSGLRVDTESSMPTQNPNHDRNWEEVLSYLPADYRELAEEHKQLEVQYGNAKITEADDLLRLVFVHAGANLPLRQLCTSHIFPMPIGPTTNVRVFCGKPRN